MVPAVLTVKEVAQLLRISTETVYRLAQKGDLRGRKIGRIWRFLHSDISDFMVGDSNKSSQNGSITPPENTKDHSDSSNRKRIFN